MSNVSTERLLKSFFDSPTSHRWNHLQGEAFQSKGFDPSGSFARRLESRVATGNPVQLIAQIRKLPWYVELCPRMHFVEARIRENLGELAAMQAAVERMQACLRALLETGEGTREAPYHVTFVTDERDLLRVFEERPRCQQMVAEEEYCFDVLTMHSGQEVWFDVTPLIASQDQRSAVSEPHLHAD